MTLGPPIVRFSRPLAASALSRICSASSRVFGHRDSSWFSGSRAAASAVVTEDWRNVAESTIRRCSAFRSQPSLMKRSVNQSSSSGCVGSFPWLPKSSGVATMPRPKCIRQTAIDDDARGERVLRRGEPAGETQPVARLIRGERRQARRRVPLDDLARRVVGAALQEMSLPRRVHLLHHHDLRHIGDERVGLLTQSPEGRGGVDVRLMLAREEMLPPSLV